MSALDDCLAIVEPGYHAPQAARPVDDEPVRVPPSEPERVRIRRRHTFCGRTHTVCRFCPRPCAKGETTCLRRLCLEAEAAQPGRRCP